MNGWHLASALFFAFSFGMWTGGMIIREAAKRCVGNFRLAARTIDDEGK